jgi:hypothetical protein
VVAEGLESFWPLRKGEGCLGAEGPDRVAISREGREDIDGRRAEATEREKNGE